MGLNGGIYTVSSAGAGATPAGNDIPGSCQAANNGGCCNAGANAGECLAAAGACGA